MRIRNPWAEFTPSEAAEHGRAVITVSRQAGGHRYPRALLANAVTRYAKAASIVAQLGVSHWGDEPSYQVILLNFSASFSVPLAWASFAAHARRMTAALAHDLRQEAAILELQPAHGAYSISVYENHDAARTRAVREEAAVQRAFNPKTRTRACSPSRGRSPRPDARRGGPRSRGPGLGPRTR